MYNISRSLKYTECCSTVARVAIPDTVHQQKLAYMGSIFIFENAVAP